jgi:muramoyltetrapeptide carboxypeptidase LdcA involved in peptidoglycan recycling
MKQTLNTYGLIMNTQANPGNLTVSHYMTIHQILTSFINKDLMIEHFNLDPSYDFRLDLKNIRTANSKKQFKAFI